MKNPPAHVDDKILHCQGCDKDIRIRHNQVGGFWHLNGWSNPHGIKFSGGYCPPCFRKLHRVKHKDGAAK